MRSYVRETHAKLLRGESDDIATCQQRLDDYWLLVLVGRTRSCAQAQGAATTLTAAVSPELEGKSGAYLSDCQVIAPSKEAQDEALAKRLWEVTEQQICEAEAARAKA